MYTSSVSARLLMVFNFYPIKIKQKPVEQQNPRRTVQHQELYETSHDYIRTSMFYLYKIQLFYLVFTSFNKVYWYIIT